MSKKCIACELCGKKYVRPGSLKRHLNVCEILYNSDSLVLHHPSCFVVV